MPKRFNQPKNLIVSSLHRTLKWAIFIIAAIAFVQVCLTGIAWGNPSNGLKENECYRGFLPKFDKDPRTGKIWYTEFSILFRGNDGSCNNEKTHFINYKFVELLSGDQEMIQTDSGTKGLNLKIFSTPIVMSTRISSAQNKFSFLTNRLMDYLSAASIHYPEISVEADNRQFDGLIQNKAKFKVTGRSTPATPDTDTKSGPYGPTVTPDRDYIIALAENRDSASPALFSYLFGEDIFYSSNGCWLIVPFTDRLDFPAFPKKHQVYALGGLGKAVSNDVTCSPAGFWLDIRADEARTDKVSLPKTVKFEHQDFHELNKPNTKTKGIFQQDDKDIGRDFIPALIENTSFYSLDYTAYSPRYDRLNMVYQKGFLSNHDEMDLPHDVRVKSLAKEKVLSGDLEYISYELRTHTNGSNRPFVDVLSEGGSEKRLNITNNCDHLFKGWESAPKLSADKTRLFFLAQDKSGDDSSRTNLYVANFLEIKNLTFDCNNPDHIKNLTTGLRLKPWNSDLQYPILKYLVSPDMQKITIFFEIEGQTVVHFFRFNKNENRIVDMYSHSISGLGKIYDIVTQEFHTSDSSESIFYVMHSRLDTPPRITKCYQRFSQFICGTGSPIFSALYYKEQNSNKDESEDVSVSLETVKFSRDCKPGASVPGFVLRPSAGEPTRKAIVSVHGGPNEAWDGRFSESDFELARAGYTVFMPNPAGSTGYGWKHTEAGHHEWGTRIFQDIICAVKHIESKGEFEKLYLMGFSFGGYIANWVLTEPNHELQGKIDALIALSPLYDLREFARTTDQFWFPQFQLKCSGELCTKPAFNCPVKPCAHSATLPIVGQNPACFQKCRDNIAEANPVPILIITAANDIRVPLCRNISQMLEAYEKGVPFTFKKVLNQGHGFMPHTRKILGLFVSDWIESLETGKCKKDGTWNLECKDKDTDTMIFHNKDENFDFKLGCPQEGLNLLQLIDAYSIPKTLPLDPFL